MCARIERVCVLHMHMQHTHTKVCARLTLYSSSSLYLFLSEEKGIERGRTVRSCVAFIANTAHQRYAPGWRVRVRGAVIARRFENLARLHRVLPRGAERAR